MTTSSTALEKIMDNIDIIKLLDHYGFDTTHRKGGMLRSKCAIHGGDNPTAFVINLDNSLWYCHTDDCGGGDIITLVEKMEGYTGQSSFPNAIRFLASFFDVDIDGLEITEKKNRTKKEIENFIKLMKSRKKKPLEEITLPNAKLVTQYRDFELSTLQDFAVGFVDEIELTKHSGDKYTLRNRLVFPIIFNDKVIGISLRKTKSKDYPKWSHQPIRLEVGNILFNYDRVLGKDDIAICEGIIDVMALHEIGIPAVCTFGANITDKQIRLLLKTGANLSFAFDGDNAGRKATKKALEIFKNKANVAVLNFDEGQDPANIKRGELLDIYARKTRYYS